VIDFRYHVVSIVAVFLALTVGLVLGASFLRSEEVSLLTAQITSANNAKSSLQNQNRDLGVTNKQLTEYIDGTKLNLVDNQLYNDYVVVVRAAGDDQASADAVLALAKQASATITADITVNATFSDPSSTASLTQLVADYTPTGQKPAGGDTVSQAVGLLSEALTAQAVSGTGTSGGAAATSSASATANPNATPTTMTAEWSIRTLKAFQQLGVIAVNTMPNAATMTKPTAAFITAPLKADTDAQTAAYVTLAQALHSAGVGPVVGGSASAAGTGGLIDGVLKNSSAAKSVSTVSDMDQTIGQVAVVFVLYQESANPSAAAGHYGITGANDGLLPKLPSLPAATPSAGS
jgi:hypothetical protein